MSIVYDYLKQIQKKNDSDVLPSKEGFVTRERKYLNWLTLFVASVFFVALIVAAFFLLLRMDKNKLLSEQIRPQLRTQIAGSSGATENDYVLGGIIYNADHPFAVINGNMLEVRARIDDQEVTTITPNSVTLKDIKSGVSRTLIL
ncbi:MAG TPA: hypothetical protein PLO78_04480 [Candidatus Omnitrophota bacterium]|nr:hypothetical protein [Candidatus Omnitrophota bacterium]